MFQLLKVEHRIWVQKYSTRPRAAGTDVGPGRLMCESQIFLYLVCYLNGHVFLCAQQMT